MSARKLAVNTTFGGVTYEAGSQPPAEVAEQITNPKAWAALGDGDSGSSSGDEGYSSSTVKELQAEIDRRNKDRGEDVQIAPASNKKADLIAALEADDAAAGDSGSGD